MNITKTTNPLPVNINNICIGDEVILWNIFGLEEEVNIKKGSKYLVTIVDFEHELIALEGIKRIYRSDFVKYEIGWECWRFCLPKDLKNTRYNLQTLFNYVLFLSNGTFLLKVKRPFPTSKILKQELVLCKQ